MKGSRAVTFVDYNICETEKKYRWKMVCEGTFTKGGELTEGKERERKWESRSNRKD